MTDIEQTPIITFDELGGIILDAVDDDNSNVRAHLPVAVLVDGAARFVTKAHIIKGQLWLDLDGEIR
jgi:hypothetical protein